MTRAATSFARWKHDCHRQTGFTLIELVVAMAVGSILVSLALPGFRNMMMNAARTTSVNEIMFALAAARSESLKQGRDVKACPSTGVDGGCLKENNEAWQSGVLVFVDVNDDDNVDDDERVVLYSGPLAAGSKTVTSATELIFRPFNQRSTNNTIFICDERGATEARAIIINVSGRPHVAKHGESGITWNCPS